MISSSAGCTCPQSSDAALKLKDTSAAMSRGGRTEGAFAVAVAGAKVKRLPQHAFSCNSHFHKFHYLFFFLFPPFVIRLALVILFGFFCGHRIIGVVPLVRVLALPSHPFEHLLSQSPFHFSVTTSYEK
ncbi:hypothetical protein BDZ94DRAFT_1262823 [Collybia nuda]|uniref:Transmembrane protein n=1 Tax=Collybia nuda TaxID=64659 RepID=A0A9P5Y584_9AGAR|nr:hypothetical protein BDZ94DRAFT_1262823 [Collybia nuda]